MLRKLSLAGGVVALIAVLAIPAADAAAPVQLSAKLKGNNEVPGPGDQNGKGDVFMSVRKQTRKVCFQLEFSKIEEPTAGHIHRGGPAVAGPIKILLFEDSAGLPVPGSVSDCVRGPRRVVRRLAKHPERFYVNLHNGEFPDGAIRGQLEPAL